jgi:hypothetical protein
VEVQYDMSLATSLYTAAIDVSILLVESIIYTHIPISIIINYQTKKKKNKFKINQMKNIKTIMTNIYFIFHRFSYFGRGRR